MKKLHEIIEAIESDQIVNYQDIHPYLKSIKTYFSKHWNDSRIYFICTFLTNSIQAGYIAPEKWLGECISGRAEADSDKDGGDYEELNELYSYQTSLL